MEVWVDLVVLLLALDNQVGRVVLTFFEEILSVEIQVGLILSLEILVDLLVLILSMEIQVDHPLRSSDLNESAEGLLPAWAGHLVWKQLAPTWNSYPERLGDFANRCTLCGTFARSLVEVFLS